LFITAVQSGSKWGSVYWKLFRLIEVQHVKVTDTCFCNIITFAIAHFGTCGLRQQEREESLQAQRKLQQETRSYFCEVGDKVRDKVGDMVTDEVAAKVGHKLVDRVGDKVEDTLGDKVLDKE
jgi:hypothetical protein